MLLLSQEENTGSGFHQEMLTAVALFAYAACNEPL